LIGRTVFILILLFRALCVIEKVPSGGSGRVKSRTLITIHGYGLELSKK
jgi:hypothetical protein